MIRFAESYLVVHMLIHINSEPLAIRRLDRLPSPGTVAGAKRMG